MKRITPVVAGIILFGLCLAACNRPIIVTKRSSATPVPATLDELSMTRTAIAGPIIATLTAAEVTPAPQTLKTTVAPTVETPTLPITPTTLTVATTAVATTPVVTVAPVTKVVKATATQKPVVVKTAGNGLTGNLLAAKRRVPILHCPPLQYRSRPADVGERLLPWTDLLRRSGYYHSQ